MQNDELNCWENLEYAPVLVTSPSYRIPLSVVNGDANRASQPVMAVSAQLQTV